MQDIRRRCLCPSCKRDELFIILDSESARGGCKKHRLKIANYLISKNNMNVATSRSALYTMA
jgi:hypothetical protein